MEGNKKVETLEKIKSIKGTPFNYSCLEIMISEDAMLNREIDIFRIVSVDVYRTDFFRTCQSHKFISKIVDYTFLLNKPEKE